MDSRFLANVFLRPFGTLALEPVGYCAILASETEGLVALTGGEERYRLARCSEQV